jgi:hypothetical protein
MQHPAQAPNDRQGIFLSASSFHEVKWEGGFASVVRHLRYLDYAFGKAVSQKMQTAAAGTIVVPALQ